ncbi:MAG: hypothetical protein RBT38_04400 [Bacteroidales bacterium]|jgi:spermidine synthase|nr:hypothetical protein [Bacteroidales bacterium]
MYHVINTGLTALILYLLSLFLYRSGIYTLDLHRKIWNSLLAVTFSITSLAGLFLALQINYKWDIPFTKTILKWHVETGIGMSLSGLFHLLWHRKYFSSILKRKTRETSSVIQSESRNHDIGTNLFITGFISSTVQLLLLKEVMNIAGGNELISGAYLSSWLLGSAAGSRLASSSPLNDLKKINLFFATGPLISLFLIILLSGLFLDPGESPSFLPAVVFTLLVLTPFTLISGFTFIKLLSFASSQRVLPGTSFSIETAGGIIAGISVTILSGGMLNTYQIFFLAVIMGLAYTVLSFFNIRKREALLFRIIVLAVSASVVILSPDIVIRDLLLRGINVTATKDTPYGNITTGEYLGERSIYYDQRLLIYNNDAAESEEDIHYAMLQTNNPASVLLISGPPGSRLKEIMKYNVKKVVYVERDPALAGINLEILEHDSALLVFENRDAFSYIKDTKEKFDAVIMLLPPPSSLSLNRFYSVGFYKGVKGKMNPGAVFACSPGVNPNYFNKEAVRLYSSVFNSMKEEFANVIPISGNKLYFIASDSKLTTSVSSLVQEKGLQNVYVGPDYLSDDLIGAKSEEILSLIDPGVRSNSSERPVACFHYQSFHLSKDPGQKIPAFLILAILVIISAVNVRKNTSIMYFSAFALAGYEIILLLVLQLTVGNMYQATGLILAGLMAGLAAGAGVKTNLMLRRKILVLSGALVMIYLIAGLLTGAVINIQNNILITVILIIMGFIPAAVTGFFFRELTLPEITTAGPSKIYSSDLAGSALGFLLFSGFMVPLLGITYSLFILPLLILSGIVVSQLGK